MFCKHLAPRTIAIWAWPVTLSATRYAENHCLTAASGCPLRRSVVRNGPTTVQPMGRSDTHAIVIGASLAGLCAARVLADFCERVTLYDPDHLPDAPPTPA